MALVSAAAARALLAGFRGVGLDAEAIREAAGISRSALEPVDGVLPADASGRMWLEAFRRSPGEELTAGADLSTRSATDRPAWHTIPACASRRSGTGRSGSRPGSPCSCSSRPAPSWSASRPCSRR